jgi:glutamate racemase
LGPIGIFDSGIGGLTVARATCDLLPHESILYFGDTAHLPYGEKSPELIQRYSTRIALHLVNSGCKAIVVACNSASSNALEQVREAVGSSIPVIDMVHPVVDSLYDSKTNVSESKVGLIGTRATISSGLYDKAVLQHNQQSESSVHIYSRPTPLLASAIEEGFYNDTIPGAVLEAYIEDGYFNEVDSIILGCTHYPLVSKELQALLPAKVEIVNSPLIVAQFLKLKLVELGISNMSDNTPADNVFQVSDLTENFRLGAQRFFGSDITLEEVSLA